MNFLTWSVADYEGLAHGGVFSMMIKKGDVRSAKYKKVFSEFIETASQLTEQLQDLSNGIETSTALVKVTSTALVKVAEKQTPKEKTPRNSSDDQQPSSEG